MQPVASTNDKSLNQELANFIDIKYSKNNNKPDYPKMFAKNNFE